MRKNVSRFWGQRITFHTCKAGHYLQLTLLLVYSPSCSGVAIWDRLSVPETKDSRFEPW